MRNANLDDQNNGIRSLSILVNERFPDRVRGLVLGSDVRRSVRRGRNRAAAGVRAVLVRFPRLRVKG